MDTSNFESEATDWRAALKANERKTAWVIGVFISTYIGIGLITDTFVLQSMYPDRPLSQSFYQLITLQTFPLATLVMIAIGGISLLITYAMFDTIMLLGTDSHEISAHGDNSMQEQQLYNVVEEMKVAAGLRYMPKVYIIEADYMNAFASGYSEKSAMIAITRGLLEKLDRAELQAVIAHELSHIRHHDIKLSLTIAVLSNILLIVIDLLFYNLLYRRERRDGDNRIFLIILILRYVLPIITVLLTLFLSRTREFMADAGAVELMRDNEPMARALLKISQDHEIHASEYESLYGATAHEQVRQASYIFDPSDIDPVKSFTSWFQTHPPIAERLKAIGIRFRKN